jgi:hypothetical protein
MACPATFCRDVLNSRFSPVNDQPARPIIPLLAYTIAFIISLIPAGDSIFAQPQPQPQPQPLEDCVERLARKAVALPHERRMSLVWTNHAKLSEQRVENLRAAFAARLQGAQVRLVQGEAAPALLVVIEQTPSQIVFTATVPAEGSTNVVIEEVARSLLARDARPSNALRLEKELRWQQEAKILSAVLPAVSAGNEKTMIVLGEDALVIYGEEQGAWNLRTTKLLPPGTSQPQRAARGQLILADENVSQVGILLPGRRCETNWTDDSPVVCSVTSAEMHPARLVGAPLCGTHTWWLRSDGPDWTNEDRLTLRNSAAPSNSAPVVEMSVPGPVFSISAGPDSGSAAVVARNVTTGNYEVYRVALSCAN